MRFVLITTTPLTPLKALPVSEKTSLAWLNKTALSRPEMIRGLSELAAARQQPIPSIPFPLRNVVRGAENLTWLNKGTLSNPGHFPSPPRQYPLAFFPLDNMHTTITPSRYAIEIRDKDFKLKDRLENSVTSLQWEWNRIGGCGRCSMVVSGNYLRVQVAPDDDIRIYLPNATTGATLWWRGYAESVTPEISVGDNGSIRIDCAGYFNWLDRIVVQDNNDPMVYSNQEISLTVQDIIDDFVVTNCPVTRGTIDPGGFTPDSLTFKVTAKDALRTCYELLGSVEYGVDASLQFFWRNQRDTISEKLWLGGNITKMSDRVDFKNILNRIYFEGGDVGGAVFTPTPAVAQDSIDRYGLHEDILSNGSITTNSVASQYMSAILQQRSKPARQMSISIKNSTKRFEATQPMGSIAVVDTAVTQSAVLWGKTANGGANKIWGTMLNSGSGQIYGGVRKEQIDRILYSLSPEDGRIHAEIQFGNSQGYSPSSVVIKRLELTQNALRQRSL